MESFQFGRGAYRPLSIAVAISLTATISYLPPSPALAQTSPRSSQGGQITTAILINAAFTQAAIERANAQIRSLYRELNLQRSALQAARRRANLSDREQARLAGELAAVNARQDDLLARLAAQDVEYAANIRAYRQGLTGLLEDGDPRVVAALQRYADGDFSALDDLQETTRIIRNARQAGVNARNGADQRSVARLILDARDKGQRTTPQALAAWQEAADIDPDDFWQWIEIARLQQDLGNLPSARASAEMAVARTVDDRDRSVASEALGDIALAQNDLSAAGTAYGEVLAISRRSAEADPSNIELARDLSTSLVKTGDLAVQQGNLSGGKAAYEESLAIVRPLADAFSLNPEFARDLGSRLNRIGDVASAQGNLGAARIAYAESLAIFRRLVADDPLSVSYSRDLSVSLIKIGDTQPDPITARTAYAESLEISRRLALADRSNTGLEMDVGFALVRMGDVRFALGELDASRAAYAENLEISRRLAASNPSNVIFARSLSVGLIKVGRIAEAMMDLTAAQSAFEESLAISSRMAAADPTNAVAAHDVGVTLARLAGLASGGILWREVANHFQNMLNRGMLAPADERLLEDAVRRADEQDQSGGPPQ